MPQDERQDKLRKKMIFRSWHRGTREIDLMLGRFADAYMMDLSDDEVLQYEELLKNNDPDLYSWISGKEIPPANVNSAVLQKLLAFYS